MMDKATAKYEHNVVENIRRITNFRFTQLIDNEKASNLYLTAFVLDPNNRVEVVNPLYVPTVKISFTNSGQPTVQPRLDLEERIGISLVQILRQEYGDTYIQDRRTIAEAKSLMKLRNPYIAHLTPEEALSALRLQLPKYLNSEAPFLRMKRKDESNREYWSRFLNDSDSDVLASLAVKIFSAVPVSMVDERTMSVVSWLNNPKRQRQKISTVSNHIIIRNFHRMNFDEPRRRPLTVNWRDINADVQRASSELDATPADNNVNQDNGSSGETEARGIEPMDIDALKWLDDGLPETLSSAQHLRFDLENDFDVRHFFNILADEAPSTDQPLHRAQTTGTSTKHTQAEKSASAATAIPDDDEWRLWRKV